MKVVVDEKIKHRFVGIAVILSIGIVFAPAILKKSQRRLDETVSLSVKLPPKPTPPHVAIREPNTLFKTVKVAHVAVPAVEKPSLATAALAKATPLSTPSTLPKATMPIDNSRETTQQHLGQESDASKLVQTASLDSAVPAIKTSQKAVDTDSHLPAIKPKLVIEHQTVSAQKSVEVKPVVINSALRSKQAYGVQLATFAIHRNAIVLVDRLKNKGYQAQYYKVLGKNGVVYYKVVVGNAVERVQAQRLQKELAQAVQINGFVVTKGIS